LTVEVLTGREREVLALMARGLDNQVIANDLGIGYATVRAHVRSLMAKLGARSRLEAVVRAAQLDLVRVPGPSTAATRSEGAND
jgi:DNA-binding NarL/FixJ family response regulator